MLTLLIIIMINNIYENNKSSKTNAAFKATLSTVKTVTDNAHNRADKATTDNNNKNSNRGGRNVQASYGHGIWYSEIIDGANNANINAIVHKQQNINNANGSSNNSNNNNNNKDNIVNRNVWCTTSRSEASKHQQKQQHQPHTQTLSSQANNECDIIIVDIEDDDIDVDNGNNNNNNEVERQNQQKHHQQQPQHSLPAKLFMNANIKFPQKHPTACAGKHAKNSITCSVNNNDPHIANDGHIKHVDNGAFNGDDDGQEEDEDDSFASLETLSDNVSIWIDGEKHWVAGVDANTTCAQLIWALLNYQNGQTTPSQQQTQLHQPTTLALGTSLAALNGENIATAVLSKTNSNQYEKHEPLNRQQKHLPKLYDKNVLEFNLRMCANEGSSNTSMCTGNQPNIQNTAKTNNNYTNTNTNTTTATSKPFTPSTINQSMPINTKENCKITQNSTLAAIAAVAATTATTTTIATPTFTAAAAAAAAAAAVSSSLSATPIISSLAPVSDLTPPLTLLPLALPPGIATVSQLATEYVIVKQYHHCEEYLDGSTKVFDVLPPRNGSNKKECELLLRYLGPAPAVYINNTTPQLSSLISTDKDSGMGSPVGSARSAKFRRRKHKSSQWLAQANTLHPKLSRCSANERLMKIILAQDETIQRQLSLLREKERQITKIEEEKHRKRERELGKNYLLETYLNGLDEAESEPETQDAEEIFIDEPYQRAVATTTTTAAVLATNLGTAITTSAVTLPTGTITDKPTSTAQALSMMTKHKIREKEAKKEKKKKRQKEKLTKDDETQAKDFNAKTNKAKDKEKVEKQQRLQHHQDLKTIDGNNINNNGNEQEIEMQIQWLEKIYTLNKQLQKEEELAAKLHAKVRKHQLRKAQQTQQEVQLEIDKLDNNLALQCGDIRKVEANLMQTNEQLQKKLLLLERLSIDYLQEQQEKEAHQSHQNGDTNTPKCLTKDADNPLRNDASTLLTNLEKSPDIQKLSLNNIKSKEEVIKLEKIIAKPSIELGSANAEGMEMKQEAVVSTQNVTINSVGAAVKATTLQPSHHSYSKVNSMAKDHCTIFATANNQQQQLLHHNHQEEQAMPQMTSIPVTAQASHVEETRSNDIVPTSSCAFIDKNMLSSLHVQNAKTIKKQMFHTQTTAAANATTTSLQPLPLPLPPTQPPEISFSIPKRLFQHTQQQYMPMASTFLTSRPQNSHQIQATNIVIVQQPSTASSPCSSHFTTTTSSALSSTLEPAIVPTPTPTSAPASASLLMGSRPPSSTSPSPSIMAMNTVDISQLGTLV